MAFCSFVKVRPTRLNPSLLPFFVKIFLLSLSFSSCAKRLVLLIRPNEPTSKKEKKKKKKKIEWKKAKKGGEEGTRRQHRSRGERTKEIIRVDELGRHEQPFAVKFSSNDTFRLAEFANSDFSNWTSTRGYPSRQGEILYFRIDSHRSIPADG